MAQVLQVVLGRAARPVGTLSFEAQAHRQHSVFAYAPSWRREGFALCPAMPLSQERFFTSKGRGPHSLAFCAPVADTCPDSWGQTILRRDRSGAGPLSDLDFLVGVDDFSRQGALRFVDAAGVAVRAAEAGRPVTPALLELDGLRKAAHAVQRNKERARDLARLRGTGTSIGGARPKCSVRDEEGTLYIAKFRGREEELPAVLGEVLALRLAARCGLRAAEARLHFLSKDEPVALIRRFDRVGEERIPYLSAQSFLGAPAADAGTYTQLAAELRAHGAQALPDLAELFGRVVFSVLVGNVDDHLRNHGLLHVQGGRWTLSPMFDVVPAPIRVPVLKTPISETSGEAASVEAAIEAAPEFGLTREAARRRAVVMARVIRAEWRGLAQALRIWGDQIKALEPAFHHPEAKALLGATVAAVHPRAAAPRRRARL